MRISDDVVLVRARVDYTVLYLKSEHEKWFWIEIVIWLLRSALDVLWRQILRLIALLKKKKRQLIIKNLIKKNIHLHPPLYKIEPKSINSSDRQK
jgi:hypothetical protein